MMENEKTTDKPVEKNADKASGNSAPESAGKPAAKPAAPSAGKPAARPADHAAERAAANPAAKTADQAAPEQAAGLSEKAAAKSAEAPAAKVAEDASGKSSGRRRTRQTGRPEGQQEEPRSGQRDNRQEGRQPARREERQDSRQPAQREERQDSRQPAQRDSPHSGRQSAERPRQQNGQQNTQQGGRRNGQQNARQDARSDRQGGRQESRRPERPARTAEKSAAKKPFSSWTWRDYALQLSVVVIGIVVTFAGSGLISRWASQRQVRTVMRMVVAELDANRGNLDLCCDRLILDRQGMLMFDRYGKDVDRIPADSLECYMSMLGSTQDFRPRSDALEVLKTSGAIQSVRDDGLLMQVLACYRALEEFGREVDNYNRRKQEAMDHFLANASPELLNRYSSLGFREAWRAMLADPLCVSFVGMMANYFEYDYDDYLTGDIADCRKTIAAINDKYRFERQDTQK